MKEARLFNPLTLPDLARPEPQPPKPKVKSPRKQSAPPKSSRPTKPRRPLTVPPAERFAAQIRRETEASWQKIKLGIATRLARMDREKLNRVLLACGITGTVAVLIIALAKLTPLLIALLAFIGLEVLLRMWDRLRALPIPRLIPSYE